MAIVPVIILVGVLVLALCVALPCCIGVYVFRDARSRGMNATLWTLIAVLAPGFVGLIIYLLVRGSYSTARCASCGGAIRKEFLLCPHCGAPLKARCSACGEPLEPEWKICPKCGAALPEQLEGQPVQEKKVRGLGTILALCILIPLALVLLLLGCMLIFGVNGGGYSSSWSEDFSVSNFSGSAEVAQWLEDCDRQGQGVYALRMVLESEDEDDWVKTRYLVYCNSGAYTASCSLNPGGWIRRPEVRIQWTRPREQGDGTTLLYFSAQAARRAGLTVMDESGRELAVQISDTDALWLNGVDLPWSASIEVEVDDSVRAASSVGVDWYAGELLVESEQGLYADETPLFTGSGLSFQVPAGMTAFVLSVYDADGRVLAQGRYELDGRETYAFEVERAGTGAEAMLTLED